MTARKASNKPTKTDIAVIALSPIIATILTITFNTNLLLSTLLSFGFPAFYLSVNKPGIVRKSLSFSLVSAVPLSFVVGYLANINLTWYIPSLFDFRLLGVVTVESMLFSFLWVYYAVVFYEYFIDLGKKKDPVSKYLKYLFLFSLILLLFLFLFLLIKPIMLYISYFYLKVGIVLLLLPLVTFLALFPKFIKKFALAGICFFCLSLLFELSALYTNQWTFPGVHFIGFIELFGQRFPYEDFLFWLLLGVYGILAYYEFFADDRK